MLTSSSYRRTSTAYSLVFHSKPHPHLNAQPCSLACEGFQYLIPWQAGLFVFSTATTCVSLQPSTLEEPGTLQVHPLACSLHVLILWRILPASPVQSLCRFCDSFCLRNRILFRHGALSPTEVRVDATAMPSDTDLYSFPSTQHLSLFSSASTYATTPWRACRSI